jgi:hypothetical protein
MKKETFIHPNENRESEVILSKGRFLGRGGIGEVHEVLVDLNGKKFTMALKEFKNPEYKRYYDNNMNQGTDPEIAFKHYQDAKKAGLKVFKTYRLSKDRKSILMTNGNDQKIICLGITDQDKKVWDEVFEGQERIKSIDNLDEFLNNLYEEVVKATKKNFDLGFDSVFFLIDRKTKTHLDFVFGDMDGLEKKEKKISLYNVLMDNYGIMGAVETFIEQYVEEESVRKTYRDKIQDFFWSKFPDRDRYWNGAKLNK